jgi:hypothetical protein
MYLYHILFVTLNIYGINCEKKVHIWYDGQSKS